MSKRWLSRIKEFFLVLARVALILVLVKMVEPGLVCMASGVGFFESRLGGILPFLGATIIIAVAFSMGASIHGSPIEKGKEDSSD